MDNSKLLEIKSLKDLRKEKINIRQQINAKELKFNSIYNNINSVINRIQIAVTSATAIITLIRNIWQEAMNAFGDSGRIINTIKNIFSKKKKKKKKKSVEE